jgi:redox-sensitive bicupin YhaK (pirin superfamily)
MSAGTGIRHSEYNKNHDREVRFLQIWIIPNKRDVQPRYDQLTLNKSDLKNNFHQILSPDPEDDGIWIHQDAWFHLGNFESGNETTYRLKRESNGLYVFLIEGEAEIAENLLYKRDGLGIWNTKDVHFNIIKDSKILLMEMPRN